MSVDARLRFPSSLYERIDAEYRAFPVIIVQIVAVVPVKKASRRRDAQSVAAASHDNPIRRDFDRAGARVHRSIDRSRARGNLRAQACGTAVILGVLARTSWERGKRPGRITCERRRRDTPIRLRARGTWRSARARRNAKIGRRHFAERDRENKSRDKHGRGCKETPNRRLRGQTDSISMPKRARATFASAAP